MISKKISYPIGVLANNKPLSIQQNQVGQMKTQLLKQLKVERISQICCIAGNQFIADESISSQYNTPLKFMTVKYIEEQERGIQQVLAQFNELNAKYENLKNQYQLIQKMNESRQIDDISQGIEKQYQETKKQQSEIFKPIFLEEYEVQINSLTDELKVQAKEVSEYRKLYNDLKSEYGILKLQIKHEGHNLQFDANKINKQMNEQQVTIDNQNEQIKKLEQEKMRLQNKYREDFQKQQSMIKLEKILPQKFQILQESYNAQREQIQKYISQISELNEKLRNKEAELQKFYALQPESVIITSREEKYRMQLYNSQIESLNDKIFNIQKESLDKDINYDKLNRQLIEANAKVTVKEEQINKLIENIKQLKTQRN